MSKFTLTLFSLPRDGGCSDVWLLRRARGGCRTGGELRGGPASGGVAVLLQRRGGRGGVLVSRVAEVRRWCRDDGGARSSVVA